MDYSIKSYLPTIYGKGKNESEQKNEREGVRERNEGKC